MKLGMVIYSNDVESVWNAFRLGVYALQHGDQVKAFLLGKGVECEQLDTQQFKLSEQLAAYIDAGGELLACGTCVKIRQRDGLGLCPLSTLQDLHGLIHDADRVLTF